MKHTLAVLSRRLRPLMLSILAAVMFITSGCGGINPKRMVPPQAAALGTKINKSIKITEVTGGRNGTFGGADYVNNDQFKKALLMTLQQSGLFPSVSADTGDLDLQASIRSQDQKTSRGLQYTGTLVVSYKITDSSGKAVWAESYDSEFSSTAFSGAARTIDAREGCARENLASLIRGLK